MKKLPHGIIVPIITPFTQKGNININKLEEISILLLEQGVHGLFPLGTCGEFYAIQDDDFQIILNTVKVAAEKYRDKSGREVQLYAGCSAITTRDVIRQVKTVEKIGGYDAVSILTPYFIKQSQKEVFQFYQTIANNTKMDIILYNNLSKTHVDITSETLRQLVDKNENIIAIKDSTGNFTTTLEYIDVAKDFSKRFVVLVGRDTYICSGLFAGAKGSIASCANVAPTLVSDIYEEYTKNNFNEAMHLQTALSKLRKGIELGSFPQAIKECMNIQGLNVGQCMEPILELDEEDRYYLKKLLKELHLV